MGASKIWTITGKCLNTSLIPEGEISRRAACFLSKYRLSYSTQQTGIGCLAQGHVSGEMVLKSLSNHYAILMPEKKGNPVVLKPIYTSVSDEWLCNPRSGEKSRNIQSTLETRTNIQSWAKIYWWKNSFLIEQTDSLPLLKLSVCAENPKWV